MLRVASLRAVRGARCGLVAGAIAVTTGGLLMFRGHPSGRILVVAGSLLALAANLGILFSFPGLETSQVVSAWGGVGMLLLFAWVAAASAPWWPVSRVTPPSDPNLSEL